jgi:hypothetical protein
VNDARVRITFTMVGMGRLTGLLPQTAAGLYSHPGPILGMSGRWAIRLDITPRHAAQFSVRQPTESTAEPPALRRAKSKHLPAKATKRGTLVEQSGRNRSQPTATTRAAKSALEALTE